VDATPEPLEIRTEDRETLAAELLEPAGRPALGTAILAHPMFANRSVFSRPRGQGVGRLFHEAGWRTLAFDFRGHGGSTAAGTLERDMLAWSYDDLVRVDLPTVARVARSRWPGSPVVVVGHSLGGHVALASHGAGLLDVDRLVIAGGNIWHRHLEPSRRVWLMKLATIGGMGALSKRRGYFPVRALRLGTDDEADPYIQDLARFALSGEWTSRDGRVDYGEGLARVTVPTFSLTSEGDRLYCRPVCASRMLAKLPRLTEHVIAGDDRGGPPPGHVAMVTSGLVREPWMRALRWLAT
jgi:predicted alpha/beta hydrolase